MSDSEYAMMFFMITLCLIPPALMGIACTTRHCLFDWLFKKPEDNESEFKKRSRELALARAEFIQGVKDNPEEAEALGIIYENTRREIIEREKPEEPLPVRSSSYD